eukprot:gnl/MRDRNA2_/MRDRNA2_54854_c0_seq2.p1 gnl/MRDRNA2_/MRDRNA2_54854_c0~~gnl/MRDRNA2_/MRDRNA2_54854_c0_seq2.p1  ORF type:complete len:410 (+),score=72.11 gnl/MRDRNA2_/MRDRNA2_54854_c0_seq2:132-1361(+)
MFFHFSFVLWIFQPLGLFHLQVAGYEPTCAASQQGTARSSSLIQSATHTLRSFVSLQSSRHENIELQKERLAQVVDRGKQDSIIADNMSMLSSRSFVQGSSATQQGGNLTSDQHAPHKLMSLLQYQSGSLGAVMFITAVFFLLGVVLMLAVAISPAYKEEESSQYVSPTVPGFGGKEGMMHYGQKMSHVPQAEHSQYSSTKIDAMGRRSNPPSSQSLMQPAPVVAGGDVKPKALSPQLVVPDDCECALVLKNPTSGWRGSFDVCDTRGSPVLQVLIEDTTVTAQQALEIRLCSSAAPGTVVARCRMLKTGKNPTFCVYQKESSEVFATVTSETTGRARLVLAAGGYFDFLSDDPTNVRAVDEHGQLHGTSESYYPSRESGAMPSMVTDERNLCLVRVSGRIFAIPKCRP